MKIVAFGDSHGDYFVLEYVRELADLADLSVCLGDFSIFSNEVEHIIPYLSEIHNDLLLIHGNHEDKDEIKELCERYKGIEFIHEKIVRRGEYVFLGYGGDGFSKRDKNFEAFIKKHKKELEQEKKLVFVFHGPPKDTLLDNPHDNYHSGSESYREAIEELQPLLVLSGHIHEGEHLVDTIGQSILINPGPDGELIDLDILVKEREKLNKEIKKNHR
jgi:uncharacterized protein